VISYFLQTADEEIGRSHGMGATSADGAAPGPPRRYETLTLIVWGLESWPRWIDATNHENDLRRGSLSDHLAGGDSVDGWRSCRVTTRAASRMRAWTQSSHCGTIADARKSNISDCLCGVPFGTPPQLLFAAQLRLRSPRRRPLVTRNKATTTLLGPQDACELPPKLMPDIFVDVLGRYRRTREKRPQSPVRF